MNFHSNPYPAHPMQSLYQPNPCEMPNVSNNPITPDYALQQLVRIKAATACEIINRRAVEAIQRQKQQKDKENGNLRDKKGSEHGSTFAEHGLDPVSIPQLEISSAPKSTANITNLSLEDMKVNPDLFNLYSMFYPYASPNAVDGSPSNRRKHHTRRPIAYSDGTHSLLSNSPSPRKSKRKSRNVTITQYNPLQEVVVDQASSTSASTRSNTSSAKKRPVKLPSTTHYFHPPNAEQVIGGEAVAAVEAHYNHYRLDNEELRFIAPAHANVQSVISPNGGIYHPCHGYSTREISIFDLFPAIVKYQSKKYNESDRVDYLVSFSDKSFVGVNNRKLKVDESEMWYTALKYLFNDITLGQFDYMTEEMRYVIKQYMSSHKNRMTFLKSIKEHSFLRVISDVAKKLPTDQIKQIMKEERERKEREKNAERRQREKEWKYFQTLVMQRSLEKSNEHQKHHAHANRAGHAPRTNPSYYPYQQPPPSRYDRLGYAYPPAAYPPQYPPPSHHHLYGQYPPPSHHPYPPPQYPPPAPAYGQYDGYVNAEPPFAHIVDEDPINGVPVVPDERIDNDKSKENEVWELVDEIVGKPKCTTASDGSHNESKKESYHESNKKTSDSGLKAKADVDSDGNTDSKDQSQDSNEADMDVYKMMYKLTSGTDTNDIKENIIDTNDSNGTSQDMMEKMEKMDKMEKLLDKKENKKLENNGTALSLSFADLSDITKSPQTPCDTSSDFIPKLPFDWATKSPSIWVDNPYSKQSKYFNSKKYVKQKRKHKIRGK